MRARGLTINPIFGASDATNIHLPEDKRPRKATETPGGIMRFSIVGGVTCRCPTFLAATATKENIQRCWELLGEDPPATTTVGPTSYNRTLHAKTPQQQFRVIFSYSSLLLKGGKGQQKVRATLK